MTALAPLAQASSGGTLFVNASTGSDTGTCRLQAHPCQTISYALTQITSGSTIRVAAGDYPQPLKITQPVSIVGAGDSASGTVIDPSTLVSDTDTDSTFAQNTIIDVTGTTGVKLTGLAIQGDNAQGLFTGCGPDFVGVYYHDASGSMTSVAVTGIQLPPADFGCQDGLGVYVASDSGSTSAVTMSKLVVNTYDKNGVTCDDAGTTCTLNRSAITGIGKTGLIAQNGFQGYGAAKVTLAGDTVKGNSYSGGGPNNEATGLLIADVAGAVSVTGSHLSGNDINGYFGNDGGGTLPVTGTWTISGNTVTGATDNVSGGQAGYGDGIVVDSTTNPVMVMGNTVKTSAEYGISLTGPTGATISTNTVTGSKSDGIYVGGPGTNGLGATGNTISSNTTNNNHRDGIFADTDATANQFTGNTANYNTRYDLEDANGATSTNTWSTNTCHPAHDSNPAGLC